MYLLYISSISEKDTFNSCEDGFSETFVVKKKTFESHEMFNQKVNKLTESFEHLTPLFACLRLWDFECVRLGVRVFSFRKKNLIIPKHHI